MENALKVKFLKMLRNGWRVFYKYWMIFAKKLSIIPTTIILFIIYFGCISVISIIHFILRKDLLDRSLADKPTFWHDKELIPTDFERCKRQF